MNTKLLIILFAVVVFISMFTSYQKRNERGRDPLVITEGTYSPVSTDPSTDANPGTKSNPNLNSNPTPKPVTTGACYVGGCSSQICSDQKDMASTCEFKEEYACYKTATCERQASGMCGWTDTPKLRSCIARANN